MEGIDFVGGGGGLRKILTLGGGAPPSPHYQKSCVRISKSTKFQVSISNSFWDIAIKSFDWLQSLYSTLEICGSAFSFIS